MKKFEPRWTLPDKNNDYYIVQSSGGYSPCIQGNPAHRYFPGSVLVNCVGAEVGRFNEESGEDGCPFLGNTNAENFWSLAEKQGLERGQEPREGACMCWSDDNGAGHVANVERVISSTEVNTFESGWSYTTSYASWKTRKKGSGNWGQASNYHFQGFIYNPHLIRQTDEDGSWGPDCTDLSRRVYGLSAGTEIIKQPNGNKKYLSACSGYSWKFKWQILCKGGDELVVAIQNQLAAAGYYNDDIDGWCGKGTVLGMQRMLKLKGFYTGKLDGSMGPATVLAWQKYINSKAAAL